MLLFTLSCFVGWLCLSFVPADLSFRVDPLYFTGYSQFNPPITALALRLFGIFVLPLEEPNNYCCNIYNQSLTFSSSLPVTFVCRSRRYSQECVHGI